MNGPAPQSKPCSRARLTAWARLAACSLLWILTNAFRAIPHDLTEQAEVDGCSLLQVLSRIILPLASPSLLTAGLFIFLGAWSEYTYALMFILDVHSDIETMPVALVTAGGSWGLLSAACEVVVVPVILVVWLFQNRIVAGLTAGALKG